MKVKTKFEIFDNEEKAEEISKEISKANGATLIILSEFNWKIFLIYNNFDLKLYKNIESEEYTKTHYSLWKAINKAIKLGRTSGFFYTYFKNINGTKKYASKLQNI